MFVCNQCNCKFAEGETCPECSSWDISYLNSEQDIDSDEEDDENVESIAVDEDALISKLSEDDFDQDDEHDTTDND
jgi:hypothetical protein